MIDWHCHILPNMDDGSQSVAESVSLINMQKSQGVSTVVLTPHFYANDESVDTFLERREKSLYELKSQLYGDSPRLLLGAEVRYYQGISRMADLKKLRIEGSQLLLLEMPMCTWSEYMIRELIELSFKGDIKIVLAHIERYYSLQKRSVWDRLFESGILAQVNASFFASVFTKRKAMKMLNKGNVHFVGSDCHNTTSRPPKMKGAFKAIKGKLGRDFVEQMNEFGYFQLVQNKN